MKNSEQRLSQTLKQRFSPRKHPVAAMIVVLTLFFLAMILTNRFFFAPKALLLLLVILVAVVLGKSQVLFRDWFVFLSVIYLSDTLRGIIYILTCKLNLPVYTLYVIKAERFLFGEIPSCVLQNALLKGPYPYEYTWFEKVLTALHGTHFIAFLFIGFFIWVYKSHAFRQFKISFYLVTLLGVSGYFAVPTAPPWMASFLFNIIPPLDHFNLNLYNMTIPDITSGFNTNPIAAMPSLHAAFPALCVFILWRLFRWKSLPFLFYTLLMFFTIVYTGDHYIVDIAAGVALAVFCYWIAFKTRLFGRKLAVEAAVPGSQPGFFKKHRNVVAGSLILIVSISLGLYNKNQFSTFPDSYSFLYVPNFTDFTKNMDQYSDNHFVQFYLGGYFLFRKKYDRALYHFNESLKFSPTILEQKKAQIKIQQVEQLLAGQSSSQEDSSAPPIPKR